MVVCEVDGITLVKQRARHLMERLPANMRDSQSPDCAGQDSEAGFSSAVREQHQHAGVDSKEGPVGLDPAFDQGNQPTFT